jgi:predicted nucleic-acid-binding Zn-ribbon protein
MGHHYQYRCSNCGYEESFSRGHGYLIHSQPLNDYLKQPKKLFHYKTDRLLRSLPGEHDDLYLKAGFQVYKCPKCKILYDKTEVVVFDEDKVVHKSEFRCSKCRSRLKLTNIHRLKKAICPKCKKRTFQLSQINTALWE